MAGTILLVGVGCASSAGHEPEYAGSGFVMASDEDVVTGLAVSGSRIFWTADRRVMTLDGEQPVTLAERGHVPSRLLSAGGAIFWVEYGEEIDSIPNHLLSLPTSGGEIRDLYGCVFDDNQYVGDFAIAGGYAFFGCADAPDSNGTIVYTEGSSFLTLVDGQATPANLVSDGAFLYWHNRGRGEILRVPLAGGNPEPVADGAPDAIALAAGYLYWTEVRYSPDWTSWTAGLFRVPVTGGTVEPLDSVSGTVASMEELLALARPLLSVDTAHAWWLDPGSATLRRVPAFGGPAVPLDLGGARPRDLDGDAENLYFAADRWIVQLPK